jgi:hypothetical protein
LQLIENKLLGEQIQMGRIVSGLLLAGCFGLCLWSQASRAQEAPDQVPAAGQNVLGKDRPSNPSAVGPGSVTAQFPLDRFQNFSAIQNGGPLPGMDLDRYIYRSGNLMRMESDASVPEYYVTDLTKQESHAVSASACLEEDYAYKLSFPFFVSRAGSAYERIPIGEETVDGHQTHVEDVIVHDPKNPVVVHFRFYEADDLQGFPIKIENRREHAYPWVIHYKDVRLAPQDPSLFVFPDKCQTMAIFKKRNSGAKSKTTPPVKP